MTETRPQRGDSEILPRDATGTPALALLQREMCREVWRPVVGWEGLYEVSHLGRVRSIPRRVRTRNGWRMMGGTLLQAKQPNSNGYLYVHLRRSPRRAVRSLHRLVGEAFLGPLPPGGETRHGRGGKLHCAVSNLSYGSHTENEADKRRDETHLLGSRSRWTKLTEADIVSIRGRYRDGALQRELAGEFGVEQTTISHIVRGATWAHIPLPVHYERTSVRDRDHEPLPL